MWMPTIGRCFACAYPFSQSVPSSVVSPFRLATTNARVKIRPVRSEYLVNIICGFGGLSRWAGRSRTRAAKATFGTRSQIVVA